MISCEKRISENERPSGANELLLQLENQYDYKTRELAYGVYL